MLDLIKRLWEPDLLVALVLASVAVLVFFVVRIGVLPRKSVPLVVGALLGAIGIGLLNKRNASELQKVLRAKEKELKTREEELERMKREFQLSDQEAQAAIARRNAELEMLTNQIVELRRLSEAERRRIADMTPAERRAFVLNMKID